MKLKRYLVTGFCLIPMKVRVRVEAKNQKSAKRDAKLQSVWKSAVDYNDLDRWSAFDFEIVSCEPEPERKKKP